MHLIPVSSHLEVENAVTKLKKHKLPGKDEIQAELILTGGETLQSEINKLSNSI